MKLLSVDIGVKNLGWCIVESSQTPPSIERAEVTDIEGATIRDSIDNLIRVLCEPARGVDIILIEQQPLKHAKMMSIMHALYGAMRAFGHPVEIVSPRLRVSYLALAKDVTYAQRKKASVARVREMYGASFFEGFGKKLDDLSDAVLQALAWLSKPKSLALLKKISEQK